MRAYLRWGIAGACAAAIAWGGAVTHDAIMNGLRIGKGVVHTGSMGYSAETAGRETAVRSGAIATIAPSAKQAPEGTQAEEAHAGKIAARAWRGLNGVGSMPGAALLKGPWARGLPRSEAAAAVEKEKAGDAPLFSFSVLSDVHVMASDPVSQRLLRAALADHRAQRPGSKLLVLNGDLTDGTERDYTSLLKLLGDVPHAPVQATMGNHDYYGVWHTPSGGMDTTQMNPAWSSQQAVALFDRMMGYNKPYHELVVDGYRFLFLSGEAYRDVDASIGEDAYLSPAQLDWLRERLDDTGLSAAERRKPVFVFLHQPLPHTLDGTDAERGVVQHEQLRALLEEHPNVILFSGHTHWNLATTSQVKRLKFTAASSASIRQVWSAENKPETKTISQSLIVDVYPNRVVIKRREHTSKRWIQPDHVID